MKHRYLLKDFLAQGQYDWKEISTLMRSPESFLGTIEEWQRAYEFVMPDESRILDTIPEICAALKKQYRAYLEED